MFRWLNINVKRMQISYISKSQSYISNYGGHQFETDMNYLHT